MEGLKYNLLSVAQLVDKGYKFEFNKGFYKIFDKTCKLPTIGEQSRGNLFYLNIFGDTFMVARNDNRLLWNRRLSHVDFERIVKVGRKNCVRGLPHITKPDNVMCKDCQLGKLASSSFSIKLLTFEHVLDLVHTNLCGPMRMKSVSGDKYFVLFIDDFSRMVLTIYLKEKLEAFNMFKVYKEKVEREIGRALKCVRSNQGGEFTSREFESYYEEHGVKR